MNESGTIHVEVAYARPDQQCVLSVRVEPGTAAREVLRLSKLVDAFPEVDILTCSIGVFGQPVDDDYPVKEGERVEIYRPLARDPREARRELAKRGLTITRE